MEKKVLYFKLPEGAKYRETSVTADGMIGIVYVEEHKCTCHQKMENAMAKAKLEIAEIPKPTPLIGGGEVYKNNYLPYWYCAIKNGRDVFMHLYMEDLTEVDLLYDFRIGRKRLFDSRKKAEYKENVIEALKNKPKEGYRWIPVYEPSPAPDGGIQFVKGKKPLVNISCAEWGQKLRQYSPVNGSEELSKWTYFLLTLRWLKDGVATLDEVVEHSENIGHYSDSDNAKNEFEKTGEREFGGLCGFVGNTCVFVKDHKSRTKHGIAGGAFCNIGKLCPMVNVNSVNDMKHKFNNCVGIPELKK